MSDVRIKAVDVADADRLVQWNGVLRDGYNAGREAAWWRSPEATVSQFQVPRPGRFSVALLATRGAAPVGAAEAHVDPCDPAVVEISVLPTARRQRIGRRLAEEVAKALAGRADLVQVETYSDAGVAFAERHGLAVGNQEVRQLLDLPASRAALDGLARPAGDVTVHSWVGPCPEDVVVDWASLNAQMDADVPVGDLTRTAHRSGVDAVRRSEERLQARGYVLVRSLARVGGRSVGYTEILVSRHDPEIVVQDDTLVCRAHRGRGVGRALKLANLGQLTDLPEAADARWVQTYTAADNAPMLALNHAIGFRDADLMTVLEGPLPGRMQMRHDPEADR